MWKKLPIITKVFVFITLLHISRAQNCNTITEEDIKNVTGECEGSSFIVADGDKCTLRSDFDNSINTLIGCVNDTICEVVDELTNSSCTACVNGGYGSSCTQNAVCASECSYNRTNGCDSDSGTQKECNLLNLEISGPSNLDGTKGITEEIFINITVNLNQNDVKVSVSSPEDDLLPIGVTDEGVYMYQFVAADHKPGEYEYNFTATALLNHSTDTNIIDSTAVVVILYEPVGITSLKAKSSGEEKTIDGNTVALDETQTITELICSAVGFGASPIQVSWIENGGQISDVSTGGNMYQSKSGNSTNTTSTLKFPSGENSGFYTCEAFNSDGEHDFFDIRTIELTQKTIPPPPYAEETDFIVAVCVLGVALFITIIAFLLALLYNSKTHKNEINKLKSHPTNTISGPTKKKGQDNPSFDHLNSKDHLPNGDPPSPRLQNEYRPATTPGINGRKPETIMPGVRQSYYPVEQGPVSTPQGMRHTDYEVAKQSYVPVDRSAVPTPGASRGGRASMLTPQQVQLKHEPALYDEVAGGGDDNKPKLPRRNDIRLDNDDGLYLQPSEGQGIYEETLH